MKISALAVKFAEVNQSLVIGDCILVESDGFVPDAIEWFQNGKISHVAIYIGEDSIVEATETGVKKNPVNKFYDTKYNWCIRRIKGLSIEQENKMKEIALNLVGKPYDFFQFIGLAIFFLVKKLTGKKYYKLIGQSGDDLMICSEIFGKAALCAGIDLFPGIELKAITPQMLYETDRMFTVKELTHLWTIG